MRSYKHSALKLFGKAAFSITALACLMSVAAIGDLIEIETYLNARSADKFLKTSNDYLHYALSPGTHGKVKNFHVFSDGNVGYQIVVQDGPHQGQVVWVLYRPDKNYVKVMDKHDQDAATHPDTADHVQTVTRVPALESQADNQRQENPPLDPQVSADDANRIVAMINAGTLTGAPVQVCQNTPDVITPAPVTHFTPTCTQNNPGDLGPSGLTDGKTMGSSENIQSDDPKIVTLATQIIQNANAQTDEQKAKAIHDWVSQNIKYNWPSWLQYLAGHPYTGKTDALTVLAIGPTQGSICHGYANLFAALARAAGLQTKVAIGQICYPGGQTWYQHSWDQVMINGNWVDVDTTWDAPYVDPKTGKQLSGLSETYFDNPADFADTHRPWPSN